MSNSSERQGWHWDPLRLHELNESFQTRTAPAIAGYELFHYWGGTEFAVEFFDCVASTSGDRVYLVIGQPAATFGFVPSVLSFRIAGQLRLLLLSGAPPVEALRLMNDDLINAAIDQFVVCCIVELHVPTGNVVVYNAGHLCPLIRQDGRVFQLDSMADLWGLPLGVVGVEFDLHPVEATLAVGDGILMCNYGVGDAMLQPQMTHYGLSQVTDHLATCGDRPDEFIRRVTRELCDAEDFSDPLIIYLKRSSIPA